MSEPTATELLRKDHIYHSEYNSFRAAKYRCTAPNASDYKYYGGRGIEFRFNSFAHFLSILGCKPAPDYTLEREDVNGHYEVGNVRWATRKEQMNNMRRNRLITAFGRTQTFTQWREEIGICTRSLQFRMEKGWCENCTFDSTAKTCTHGYSRKDDHKKAMRNRKDNHLITVGGKIATIAEWSETTGIKYSTIHQRIVACGWCEQCAASLPIGQKCRHKKIIQ